MEHKEFKYEFHYLQRWSEHAADVGWVRQSSGGSGRRSERRRWREAIDASRGRREEAAVPTRS